MPIPKGYTLDQPVKLPSGYTLDGGANDGGAAAAAANPFGNAPAHAAAPPVTGTAAVLQKMAAPDPTPLSDLGVGVVKSVGNTANNIGKMLIPDAALKAVGATPPSAEQQASYFAPQNTTQAVGKLAGDVGQFFIPGPAEEMGAAKLAPFLGKAGAKIATATLGSGAVNKAEGGSFTSGMAGGALGSALGQGIQKVAPALAETALGVRATDRAYDRTPGEFIINETKGVKPANIAEQANTTVDTATNHLNQNALASPARVNLAPARAMSDSFLRTAKLRNNPEVVRDIAQVGQQLSNRAGVPIPATVSASEGLALKRGLNDLTSYNPNMTNGLGDAAVKGTVGALQPELSAAIPNYDALNSTISTAIPVAKRALATDLNASMLQRVAGRFARPTGALVGAGLGYEGGKREGGTPGAIAGALTGLVAPEILANPTVLMTGARTANAAGPALGKLANASAQEYLRRRP